MGKFPEGDAEIKCVKVCLKCKRRNRNTRTKCRVCGSQQMRPKRSEIRAKK
jgi:large subunit ribosomal protein L40e